MTSNIDEKPANARAEELIALTLLKDPEREAFPVSGDEDRASVRIYWSGQPGDWTEYITTRRGLSEVLNHLRGFGSSLRDFEAVGVADSDEARWAHVAGELQQ